MTRWRFARSRRVRVRLALMLLVAWFGCGDPTQGDEQPAPTPITDLTSGATCPSGSKLSYANFGQAFMSSYCLRCHSQSITGAARQAPPDRNFDDVTLIRSLARLIDQQAGAGPLAVHNVMPPSPPTPSMQERQLLAEWLACGAP